jgi:hypothetical protein
VTCYLHPDRTATKVLNIPCAPGGKLDVCDDCFAESGRLAVFQKYSASHQDAITQQRAASSLLGVALRRYERRRAERLSEEPRRKN